MAFVFRRTFHTVRHLARIGTASREGFPRSNMNSSDLPIEFLPPINRTMRELDKSFFQKIIPIAAATISDPKNISPVRKVLDLTGENLSLWPIKNLVPDPQAPGAKCLLLRPGVTAGARDNWSKELQDLVDQGKIKIHSYDLKLSYDDWGMKLILDAILPEMSPEETETPAGFSIIGHVAHVNLREQYLPWKNLIGQVLLDKNPQITTVINKLNDVGAENEFRTFPYEVLAGPDDLDVTVHEADCEFKFNFGKVYWNTRLNTEHQRVIQKFKPGEAVCDVMAGVGPFAVPAGKRKVFVWANDLNPESYKALEWAAKRNKVDQYVEGYCKDGRDFIRWATDTLPASRRFVVDTTKQKGKPPIKTNLKEPETFDHYVMNLPKTAVEFLDAFRGLYYGKEALFEPHTRGKLPMIHVYLFTERNGPGTTQTREEEQQVCKTISQHLRHDLTPETPDMELLYVRLVSPNKKMYRASFRLPPEVAFDHR